MAFVKWLQNYVFGCDVRRMGVLQGIVASGDIQKVDVFNLMCEPDHIVRHRIGTMKRCPLRQLGTCKQIELVLRRNKSARYLVEQDVCAHQKAYVNEEYDAGDPQRVSDNSLITIRVLVEEMIEWPEKPSKCAFNGPSQQVFAGAMALKQLSRKSRRECQGVDRRDHRREGDRYRKLLIELAG